MNKLTAEKCREEILNLNKFHKPWMNERENLYLEALEIALPILEQQERGDGWIEWGGKCGGNDQPAIGLVEVKFRNGGTGKAEACDWHWPHDGIASDIIAYRIIPENSDEN